MTSSKYLKGLIRSILFLHTVHLEHYRFVEVIQTSSFILKFDTNSFPPHSWFITWRIVSQRIISHAKARDNVDSWVLCAWSFEESEKYVMLTSFTSYSNYQFMSFFFFKCSFLSSSHCDTNDWTSKNFVLDIWGFSENLASIMEAKKFWKSVPYFNS